MEIEFNDLKKICKYLKHNSGDELCVNESNTSYNISCSCKETLCPLNNTTKCCEMLNEMQIAELMLQYCKDLVSKYDEKEFDYDHALLIGILCGLLTTLNKVTNIEDKKNDIMAYTIDVIKEIVSNNSKNIQLSKIIKLKNDKCTEKI